MSFENASQSYYGAFSKGGKDSDATISGKFTKEDFFEREKLLNEKLFGKSDREKGAENQVRKLQYVADIL